MPTKSANLVKIGPGYSEILAFYADFCRIFAKVIICKSLKSGVTGPNLTKVLHNAEKFKPVNLLKLELQYCHSFQNASTTNKGMSPISPLKLVTMATSLEILLNEMQVIKHFDSLKIW